MVTVEVLHVQAPPLQRPHQVPLLGLQVFLCFRKKNLKTQEVKPSTFKDAISSTGRFGSSCRGCASCYRYLLPRRLLLSGLMLPLLLTQTSDLHV